jgi:hypothetical protein
MDHYFWCRRRVERPMTGQASLGQASLGQAMG